MIKLVQTIFMDIQIGSIFQNATPGQHPVVFLGWLKKNEVLKACIISSENIGNNRIMQDEHFIRADDNGNIYKIQNNPSYLITDYKFAKEINWIITDKVGQLSNEGIAFVQANNILTKLVFSNEHIKPISQSATLTYYGD